MLHQKYQVYTQNSQTSLPAHIQSENNLDKFEAQESRLQKERNLQIQHLMAGDQSIKIRKLSSQYNSQKYPQIGIDSKGNINDIPYESNKIMQNMVNFKQNSQSPLKRGNHKSHTILPQFKSASSLSSDQLQLLSPIKIKHKFESQQDQGINSHFQTKKLNSQITLNSIINLNHPGLQNRQQINGVKSGGITPKGYNSEQKKSENNTYVKDRFTNDWEFSNKKNNQISNGNSLQIYQDPLQSNSFYRSQSMHNTSQKFSVHQQNLKRGSLENQMSNGFEIGKIKFMNNHSQQNAYTPASFINSTPNQEHNKQPLPNNKYVTIQKKPSSRHQPSRMKFTVNNGNQQGISLPTSPQQKSKQGFFSIRGSTPNQFQEDARPQSQESPPYKSKMKIETQTSMNNFHNIYEPFHSAHNLNQNQQTFIQRSMNMLSELFPQGFTQPSMVNVPPTINDMNKIKKSQSSYQKSLKDIPFSVSGLDPLKSIKKISFNVNNDELEDDKQLALKKQDSSLKDQPQNTRSNTLQIKDFQGNEKTVDENHQNDNEKQKQSLSQLKSFNSNDKQGNLSKRSVSQQNTARSSQKLLEDNLSNLSEDKSEIDEKDTIRTDTNTLMKYQKGIDIDKEIMEKKLEKHRSQQKENNAMENHNSQKRMERSTHYNFLKQKSKMLEERKIQKKKELQDHLQYIKEKNVFVDHDLDDLEIEIATGGKFNQKNYNNLKISKTVKRSKQQVIEIFKKTIKLLIRLNIEPQEVLSQKIFSSKPFEKKDSHKLFECVKSNDLEEVSYILKDNKYLVYEFDFFFLSPLHWACKRGLYKMAQLLIRFNSDLEAEDMVGRTPLFFAIESNYEDIIELLLINKASPYKTKYADYAAMSKSYVVSKMLGACRRLHWAIKINPNPNKAEQWKKEVNKHKEEEERKKKELGLL